MLTLKESGNQSGERDAWQIDAAGCITRSSAVYIILCRSGDVVGFSRNANRNRKAPKRVSTHNREGAKYVCNKNKILLALALLRSNRARSYGRIQSESRHRL
jgi:hypothetical protein